MIKDKLFIDLDPHVDLKKFDSLKHEICRGMATARDLAIYGLQVYHPGTVNPHAQGIDIKSLHSVVNTWNQLSENDPYKIAGKDLDYNQLTTYLKFLYGAYDHYIVYKLFDSGNADELTDIGKHFPSLIDYLISFRTSGIFQNLHSAVIMGIDANGIPWEHRDPEDPVTGIFDPDNKNPSGQISEFIHIKTDCDRPFYVIHPKTKEKVFINARSAWWDERDWHGGYPIQRPSFTVRVNGRFSDEFREKLNIVGYDSKS
jgi:hypothetical protein